MTPELFAPVARPPFYSAFETTYLPGHDVDVAETTGHDRAWRTDIDRVLAAGVTRFRYPLRWHRIEARPGHHDWSEPDRVLGYLAERGAEVVVDLVHHTSHPAWLDDGFRDRRFAGAFVRFAEAAARRYPHLGAYTVFNEPFATLFLAGSEALWPPYDRGVEGFVRLLRSVLPGLSEAARCWRELLPQAAHVWIDTAEHHRGTPGAPAQYAALANDRRHVVLDLALQRDLDRARPYLDLLLRAGGESLLDLDPVRVDVLGLDYYCHSEWFYDESGSGAPSPHPVGFAAIAEQYAARYGLPVLLSETNIRGLPSDRASWLRYVLEQYELAVGRGVDLRGLCWFPSVDSRDWDSLLARPAGRTDPVGVVSLDADDTRRRTSFTEVWEAAARGARASELPAYRFQSPCDEQLRGFLPQMAHWDWVDPPEAERVPPQLVAPAPMPEEEPVPPSAPDLVVLSHLRWPWVWQRPQHLVSRLARQRAASGARTWYLEEPVPDDVEGPELRSEERDGVTRVWLAVPREWSTTPDDPHRAGSFDLAEDAYAGLLNARLREAGRSPRPDVWLYTPMGVGLARQLAPGRLVYDVMDDLASFRRAPEGLRLRQRAALAEADLVFAGGRSLHRGVVAQGRTECHLFPSGVETAHYERSRLLRGRHERPVAGYVGVIDERMDLDLVRDLVAALPDWDIRLVGPVVKIDEAALPKAPNLSYPGLVAYDELPEVMATFDVALMPFALNEATRSISPTKTLEYLAAGLPVVSTRVPDVVADYERVVHFADDAAGFAAACRQVVQHATADRDRLLRPIQARHEWDVIAEAMAERLDRVPPADGVPARQDAESDEVSA